MESRSFGLEPTIAMEGLETSARELGDACETLRHPGLQGPQEIQDGDAEATVNLFIREGFVLGHGMKACHQAVIQHVCGMDAEVKGALAVP